MDSFIWESRISSDHEDPESWLTRTENAKQLLSQLEDRHRRRRNERSSHTIKSSGSKLPMSSTIAECSDDSKSLHMKNQPDSATTIDESLPFDTPSENTAGSCVVGHGAAVVSTCDACSNFDIPAVGTNLISKNSMPLNINKFSSASDLGDQRRIARVLNDISSEMFFPSDNHWIKTKQDLKLDTEIDDEIDGHGDRVIEDLRQGTKIRRQTKNRPSTSGKKNFLKDRSGKYLAFPPEYRMRLSSGRTERNKKRQLEKELRFANKCSTTVPNAIDDGTHRHPHRIYVQPKKPPSVLDATRSEKRIRHKRIHLSKRERPKRRRLTSKPNSEISLPAKLARVLVGQVLPYIHINLKKLGRAIGEEVQNIMNGDNFFTRQRNRLNQANGNPSVRTPYIPGVPVRPSEWQPNAPPSGRPVPRAPFSGGPSWSSGMWNRPGGSYRIGLQNLDSPEKRRRENKEIADSVLQSMRTGSRFVAPNSGYYKDQYEEFLYRKNLMEVHDKIEESERPRSFRRFTQDDNDTHMNYTQAETELRKLVQVSEQTRQLLGRSDLGVGAS